MAKSLKIAEVMLASEPVPGSVHRDNVVDLEMVLSAARDALVFVAASRSRPGLRPAMFLHVESVASLAAPTALPTNELLAASVALPLDARVGEKRAARHRART